KGRRRLHIPRAPTLFCRPARGLISDRRRAAFPEPHKRQRRAAPALFAMANAMADDARDRSTAGAGRRPAARLPERFARRARVSDFSLDRKIGEKIIFPQTS